MERYHFLGIVHIGDKKFSGLFPFMYRTNPKLAIDIYHELVKIAKVFNSATDQEKTNIINQCIKELGTKNGYSATDSEG